MDNRDASDEIVSFPVPKRYLCVVIQALAKAMENNTTAVSLVSAPVPTLPWPVEPTEGQCTLLWNATNMTNLRGRLRAQAAITLLDLTSERPGERVYFSEVVANSGRDRSHASADLGVMTKVIKKMFQLGNVSFNTPAPFHWDTERQEAYYVMDSEIAEAWKATA